MPPVSNGPDRALARLLEVMRRLRDPVDGCPWDLVQNHTTIAPYTIEEAYEAADAIDRADAGDLRDELGDILLQVVFQAQIAHEAQEFDFASVADAIADKMIRRHPHIFAGDSAAGPEGWEEIKAAERRARSNGGAAGAPESALDGVARTLPPTTRAMKLQRRAARIGFDFPDWHGALAKTHEELVEVVRSTGDGDPAKADEVGDLLFAAINLARKLDVDPDKALKQANDKFERRFREMENSLRQRGEDPAAVDLADQEVAWIAAKRAGPIAAKGE